MKNKLKILGLGIMAISIGACSTQKSDSYSEKTIKVMSFNIRNSDADDGINNWNQGRKERAVALINAYKPDIFGVQEAKVGTHGDQISDFKALPNYTWYGVGRDDGKEAGEFEGILYLEKRFSLVKSGEFWLSPTPDKPGTTFSTSDMNPSWDIGNPRMATWLILHDKLNNIDMLVVNQHWAVTSATQKNSAILLRSMIEKLDANTHKMPVIVMGDFNMTDESKDNKYSLNPQDAYSVILSGDSEDSKLKLIDAYRSLYPKKDGEMTFHGFHGGTSYYDTKTDPSDIAYNNRIDFIFTSPDLKCISAEIIRKSFSVKQGEWPSDHYPVLTTFTLE